MRVAVVLAAGSSRRWGPGNKLFDRRGGRTLLARVLALTRRAPVERVIVVIGWQSARVAREVHRQARNARVIRARDHREGLGASVRAAARALRPVDRAVLLFLGDMPWIDPRLAARLLRVPGAVVRPAWRGRPGHPVVLRGDGIAALAGAHGDRGPARGLASVTVAADRRCTADRDHPARGRLPPPRLR